VPEGGFSQVTCGESPQFGGAGEAPGASHVNFGSIGAPSTAQSVLVNVNSPPELPPPVAPPPVASPPPVAPPVASAPPVAAPPEGAPPLVAPPLAAPPEAAPPLAAPPLVAPPEAAPPLAAPPEAAPPAAGAPPVFTGVPGSEQPAMENRRPVKAEEKIAALEVRRFMGVPNSSVRRWIFGSAKSHPRPKN